MSVACALPGVAVPIVGASATVGAGVTAFEAVENALFPIELTARTRNRYVVPFVSPVIVCIVAVELNVVCATGPTPT